MAEAFLPVPWSVLALRIRELEIDVRAAPDDVRLDAVARLREALWQLHATAAEAIRELPAEQPSRDRVAEAAEEAPAMPDPGWWQMQSDRCQLPLFVLTSRQDVAGRAVGCGAYSVPEPFAERWERENAVLVVRPKGY
jgi:hypothetical protein